MPGNVAGPRQVACAGGGGGVVDEEVEPTGLLTDPLEGAHEYARWATAELRSAMGRYPDDDYLRSLDDYLGSLLAELSATSASFRSHWWRGEVTAGRSAVKRLRHPARGWLVFQSEMLHDAERDHWIVIYTHAG